MKTRGCTMATGDVTTISGEPSIGASCFISICYSIYDGSELDDSRYRPNCPKIPCCSIDFTYMDWKLPYRSCFRPCLGHACVKMARFCRQLCLWNYFEEMDEIQDTTIYHYVAILNYACFGQL